MLPVLLKCEYVCAHVALPEKRVLFACDYWPRSECVCVYLAHAETGPLILLTGRRAAQSSGEIKSQIPLSLSLACLLALGLMTDSACLSSPVTSRRDLIQLRSIQRLNCNVINCDMIIVLMMRILRVE